MRLIIETDNEEGDLATVLLDLARRSGTTVTAGDPVWTPERAESLIREVTPRGRQLLRAVAVGGGWVDGEAYRARYGDAALKGPSAAVTKAVTRGIREGWLPEDAELPLTSSYDGRSSWQKTGGYRLPRHLAGIFHDAFHRLYPPRPGDPQAVVSHLTALYEEMGHDGRSRALAEEFLEAHADDLSMWLQTRVQPWRPEAGWSALNTEQENQT